MNAREWRALGFPIPSYVDDGEVLENVHRTPDGGVSWKVSWDQRTRWNERAEGIFELEAAVRDPPRHKKGVEEPTLMHLATKLFDLVGRVLEALPPIEENVLAIKLARDGLAEASHEMETMGMHRKGGRTQRTIVEAVAFAATGRTVLLLAPDRAQAKAIHGRIAAMTTEDVRHNIMVRPYTDLERGGVLVGQEFSAILEDHAVTEARARDWVSKKISLVGYGRPLTETEKT